MPIVKLKVAVNPKEFLYISNILSLSRIVLLPLIVLVLVKNTTSHRILAFILIILAMLTDILDGYLARRLKEVSALGKILDPISDKICIGIIAIVVTILQDFPWWAMGFIILRDLVIVICGIFMVKQWTVITSSNIWGKATSLCQTIAIVAYAFQLPLRTYPLTVAMVFTGVSAVSYCTEFYNLMKEKK